MLELGALLVGIATLAHLRTTWKVHGLEGHATHSLVMFVLGSAGMTYGAWAHRQEFMGLTIAAVAAPGIVALWALAKRGSEAVAAYRKAPTRLGR